VGAQVVLGLMEESFEGRMVDVLTRKDTVTSFISYKNTHVRSAPALVLVIVLLLQ
jgi:hypothetical protein